MPSPVRKSGWWLPSDDEHFLKSARKGYYQRHALLLAMSFVYRWELAIDVGAHVGFMAADMLRLFDDVLCLEPDPLNYYCLTKNVPRANRLHCAAGAEDAHVSLENPATTNSGAWVVSGSGDIRMVRLDNLHTKLNIGFIKIDTQGSELDVLLGAERTLRVHQPTVMVECSPETAGPVHAFMHSVGARPVLRVRADTIYVFDKVNHLDIEWM